MRNTDGSRSKPAMFQIDPPTEAIIERARDVITPQRKASRSEVLRHFAAMWAGSTEHPLTPTVQAVIGTASPVRVLSRAEAGLSPDVPPLLRPAAETVVERYRRLLAASGMTQAALERHLGLSSRGKLQHALRRGEVPPEVAAWMQEREEGGR